MVRAELKYLTDGRKDAANLIEWFLPLNALLARTALDPLGFASLRAETQKSTDPVVALYARLEVLAPRTPDRLTAVHRYRQDARANAHEQVEVKAKYRGTVRV